MFWKYIFYSAWCESPKHDVIRIYIVQRDDLAVSESCSRPISSLLCCFLSRILIPRLSHIWKNATPSMFKEINESRLSGEPCASPRAFL